MNQPKTISLTCVLSVCLWTVGTLFVLTETILEMTPGVDARFWSGVGKLGLILCMGGATLTIKGYAVRCVRTVQRDLQQHVEERERDAFELGVDHAQSRGSVRPLR